MSDAFGIVQFLRTVAEMAGGADAPSVNPVWSREMFSARDPPRITCSHRQDDVINGFPLFVPSTHDPHISYRSVIMGAPSDLPVADTMHHSFFFGPSQLHAIRRSTPQHATTFEALTAFLWRCYATALGLDPKDQVRLLCIVNARGKAGHIVPIGYYGNAFAFHASFSTTGKLCPVGSAEHALELVKKAKDDVTPEYMQSLADALVIKNRTCLVITKSLLVFDLRRTGFVDVDFGWGKAVYAGPAGVEVQGFGVYIPFRNNNGEDGIIVPYVCRLKPWRDLKLSSTTCCLINQLSNRFGFSISL